MKLGLHRVAALALLLSGCVSRQTVVTSPLNAQGLTKKLNLSFKAAALAQDHLPAAYSFQRGKGKLGSAKEALADAGEIAMSGPVSGVIIPGIIISEWPSCGASQSVDSESSAIGAAMFVGAVGAVYVVGAGIVAPAVAAKGLARSWKNITPQELAAREIELQKAFDKMASQNTFQAFVLNSAEDKSPGRLFPMETNEIALPMLSSVDSILEAYIEELRLERKGSDEGSYFLRIKAHARLARKDNGKVLYEQSVEYKSGCCLFLDWTCRGALESVAQTGYRALADYSTNMIF